MKELKLITDAVCGGSWDETNKSCCVTNKCGIEPIYGFTSLGFRLEYRTLLGGSWYNWKEACSINFWSFNIQDDRSKYVGFRLMGRAIVSGGWYIGKKNCSVVYRRSLYPTKLYLSIGYRLTRSGTVGNWLSGIQYYHISAIDSKFSNDVLRFKLVAKSLFGGCFKSSNIEYCRVIALSHVQPMAKVLPSTSCRLQYRKVLGREVNNVSQLEACTGEDFLSFRLMQNTAPYKKAEGSSHLQYRLTCGSTVANSNKISGVHLMDDYTPDYASIFGGFRLMVYKQLRGSCYKNSREACREVLRVMASIQSNSRIGFRLAYRVHTGSSYTNNNKQYFLQTIGSSNPNSLGNNGGLRLNKTVSGHCHSEAKKYYGLHTHGQMMPYTSDHITSVRLVSRVQMGWSTEDGMTQFYGFPQASYRGFRLSKSVVGRTAINSNWYYYPNTTGCSFRLKYVIGGSYDEASYSSYLVKDTMPQHCGYKSGSLRLVKGGVFNGNKRNSKIPTSYYNELVHSIGIGFRLSALKGAYFGSHTTYNGVTATTDFDRNDTAKSIGFRLSRRVAGGNHTNYALGRHISYVDTVVTSYPFDKDELTSFRLSRKVAGIAYVNLQEPLERVGVMYYISQDKLSSFRLCGLR